MAASPVPVIAPGRVPILPRAPLREGPWLRVSVRRGTYAGQTQAGGSGENRCSETWNGFHEALPIRPTGYPSDWKTIDAPVSSRQSDRRSAPTVGAPERISIPRGNENAPCECRARFRAHRITGASREAAAVRAVPSLAHPVPQVLPVRQVPTRGHGPRGFRPGHHASHGSRSSPSCCPSPDPSIPPGTIAGKAPAAPGPRMRRPRPPDPAARLRPKSLQQNAE